MPEIFESFSEARRQGFLIMKSLKERGYGVAGTFCSYVPVELFLAAGIIPVGLCSTSDETIGEAEKTLPRNLCPLIKASYGFAVTGKCPYMYFADLVVGETTCDGKIKMYELLGEALVGIDCGSSFCKGAFLRNRGVKALARRATSWDVAESGRQILEELEAKGSAAEEIEARCVRLAATGYGRKKISGARVVITEISAHARGAEFLCPGVRTVIDIGGQDSKLIAVEGGRVRDFQMNDKCAAGSGRFLEMVHLCRGHWCGPFGGGTIR